MKSKLVRVLLLAGLLGIGAFTINAAPDLGHPPAVAASGCAINTFHIYADSYYEGQGAIWCVSVANAAAQSGPCWGTWNDCMTSFQLTLHAGWCLQVFDQANYINLQATYTDSTSSLLVSYNDRMSSWRFYQGPQC